MSSVFANTYNKTPQVWTAQGAYITWGESGSNVQATKDTIFQALSGVTVSYGRQVSTQYPIGGSAPIQLIGAPAGQLQLNTLIGPTTNLKTFLQAIGKACTPIDIKVLTTALQSGEDCTKSNLQNIQCIGCVATQLQYSLNMAQSGMAIATGGFTLTFTQMKWVD